MKKILIVGLLTVATVSSICADEELIFSAKRLDKEALKKSLDKGTKDELGKQGITALAQALMVNVYTPERQDEQLEIVKLLLGGKSDPNVKIGAEGRFYIPLYYAIQSDNKRNRAEFVEALLKHGADPNLRYTKWDYSVLSTAAARGLTDIMTLLLDNGAEIDHQDKLGQTALIWAAKYNRPEAIELLLEKGADRYLTDEEGRTAEDHSELVSWQADDATQTKIKEAFEMRNELLK